MFPKAHLTSHTRMSGSKWVATSLGLPGSLWPYLYTSSVYSYHLFISSASVRSLLFLSCIVPMLAGNLLLISPVFLKRSLVFPILLFPLFLFILHLRRLSYLSLLFSGTLHSVGYTFCFLTCLSLLSLSLFFFFFWFFFFHILLYYMLITSEKQYLWKESGGNIGKYHTLKKRVQK